MAFQMTVPRVKQNSKGDYPLCSFEIPSYTSCADDKIIAPLPDLTSTHMTQGVSHHPMPSTSIRNAQDAFRLARFAVFGHKPVSEILLSRQLFAFHSYRPIRMGYPMGGPAQH